MEKLELVFAELEVGKMSIGYRKGELVFFVKTGLPVEKSISFLQKIGTGEIGQRELLDMPVVDTRTYGSWEKKKKKREP